MIKELYSEPKEEIIMASHVECCNCWEGKKIQKKKN